MIILMAFEYKIFLSKDCEHLNSLSNDILIVVIIVMIVEISICA